MMITVDTAAQLLDFDRMIHNPQRARDQLHGAVAMHNILQRHRVAYLADEVGMGKTYVALGVVALLRHFTPDLRVLVITPRENIQQKWERSRASSPRTTCAWTTCGCGCRVGCRRDRSCTAGV